MKLKYFIEWIAVRIIELGFRILPKSVSLWCGETLGSLMSLVISKRNKLILDNLHNAFPEKPASELNQIAKKVWKNLGRTAVEFIYLPKINKENYKDHFLFERKEIIDEATAEDKGIIFITLHLSNWEMAGIAHQFDRRNLVAIARPMKNPLVENWVQSKRKAGGMEIILHRQAVRGSLRLLKKKKCIAILVDQNLYQGGVFVNLFGRPAATTTLPALLYTRTKAPVIFGYSLREGKKFKIVYESRIHFPEIENPDERLRSYTEIINHHVEAVVRRYPENWFWIHNRWKRSPVTP